MSTDRMSRKRSLNFLSAQLFLPMPRPAVGADLGQAPRRCLVLMRGRGAGALAVVAALAAAGCLDRNAVPLVEVPPTAPSGEWLAVLLSGDGGWAETDAALAAALLRHDIPTVGLNSLRYFWFERTPAEASTVLRRMLDDTLAKWKRQRAVVIGFSRGANTAPFMVDGLPRELKRRVGLVALLSPTPDPFTGPQLTERLLIGHRV